MSIIFWAFILVLQTAAFTWVSRARNSGSIVYHTIASVFSNSIWFISQIFIINFVAKPDTPLNVLLTYLLVYTVSTTIGATLMHYVSMEWLEKGKRKVGA